MPHQESGGVRELHGCVCVSVCDAAFLNRLQRSEKKRIWLFGHCCSQVIGTCSRASLNPRQGYFAHESGVLLVNVSATRSAVIYIFHYWPCVCGIGALLLAQQQDGQHSCYRECPCPARRYAISLFSNFSVWNLFYLSICQTVANCLRQLLLNLLTAAKGISTAMSMDLSFSKVIASLICSRVPLFGLSHKERLFSYESGIIVVLCIEVISSA